MDCLAQLDAFCTIAEADELPASAQVIYIHLLNINGRLHWREWFSVANSMMEKLTGLTNKTIVSAKNRLKQSGLIDYKSDGKKTTRYRIITHDSTQDCKQNTIQAITQDSIQGSIQDGIQTTTQLKRLSTLKRVVREKPDAKKFMPPSIDEVKQYCKEKNLVVDADYFFTYFQENDWKDSKGIKVKSWKQKMLTWNKFELERKPKTQNNAVSYPINQGDDDFGVAS